MTDAPDADLLSTLITSMGVDRRLAHATIFPHRHPDATPDFHYEIINLWHSTDTRVLIEAFRGGAKSTLGEEAIVLGAAFREFKNCIVLGETYDRACERLKAIKHELENNAYITGLFGNLVGETWQEGRIVLTNGICVQAFGRGQSLRGSKHLDARPDFVLADDVESEESVATPEAIEKCMRWLMSVVMPALAPGARVRINGTPLSPRSVLAQLASTGEWSTRIYPIEHLSPAGDRLPTWPDRFTLEWIDKEKATYEKLGLHDQFQQEYMCQAEDASQKVFTADMFKVEPVIRTWQPVSCAYDPARTVTKRSDFTGKAAWSWINNRLVVWECSVHKWKPDEIVADMFAMDERYNPVGIGVEEDGLNEFIMQPIRHEQNRRNTSLPIVALRAPKGKIDFIKGLQPFFKAGEIIFANAPLPDLQSQLLAFPTGHDDGPNVLAYALKMRPGQPVYDAFGIGHIVDSLDMLPRTPAYLAVNATGQVTTGVLAQLIRGTVHIIADWVREGDPGAQLKGLVQDASLAARAKLTIVAPPSHFLDHDTVGLRGAAGKIPVSLGSGALLMRGRDELRGLLNRTSGGNPMLRVGTGARWTLGALSGGYAREVTRAGVLTEFAVQNHYRVLMEGLESLAGLLNTGFDEEDDNERNYGYTAEGRRYLSALAR